MPYKVIDTSLPEILLLEPTVYADERGHFFESFNKKDFFNATNCNVEFVQDNVSFSHKGVIRGLHFQNPNPQGKLIRVISGTIYDLAVDLRRGSKNFGQWVGVELSRENNLQLWVPEGFGHGFQVLSQEALVSYKTTDYWNSDSEHTIAWDDSFLSISWPIKENVTLNQKDLLGTNLNNSKVFT
ncbi:dTDP-4-dehydrorhamnose 3,5-epimerase [Gammaproteobacteria bacterium]|nr:dTDP-4-dehydrorhamnose 3,5-epimerase [Gammaproteobacteria bacterium]